MSYAKLRSFLPVPPCSPPVITNTIAENGGKGVSLKKSEPTTANPAKTSGKRDSRSARPELLEEVRALVGRAKKSDKKALPQLRATLDELPKLARILVDPADQAEWSLIQNYAGGDLLVKEALPRVLKEM